MPGATRHPRVEGAHSRRVPPLPHVRGMFDIAAGIASLQHGRVARRQLLAAGIDGKRVERWLADGRLRRVHRGVYALGHTAPSTHADYAVKHRTRTPTSKLASRASQDQQSCAARSAATSRSASSRTVSCRCCEGTTSRSRARTSTTAATRSTATGRSTTSPSSSCRTASTPADARSSRTSRAAGGRTTSPTRTATSSSAARRPWPTSVSGSRPTAPAPRRTCRGSCGARRAHGRRTRASRRTGSRRS